jgi:hypothetical protein
LSLYASRFYSTHGREVFQGALEAWRNRSDLLDANAAHLAETYKSLCDQCLDFR